MREMLNILNAIGLLHLHIAYQLPKIICMLLYDLRSRRW